MGRHRQILDVKFVMHACSRMSESRSGLAPPLKKQEIWCGLMRKIADFLEILARPDEKTRKFWLRQNFT